MLRFRVGFLILVCTSAAFAQAPAPAQPTVAARLAPRSYVCYRATGKIVVDGKLDEPSWTNAGWSELFVDIEGSKQLQPRYITRMKMLWDDNCFYIAAEMDEPHLWATIKKHDAVIFHDNDFEVFIDPDGDNHNYMELEINALNTVWDLRLPKPYRDGGKADDAWEAEGLRTAVKLSGTLNYPFDVDKGWTVEMAIPWEAFAKLTHQPLPPAEGDLWRVNFSRVEWRYEVNSRQYAKAPGQREDNWVWSPQGVIDMHRPERWGYVHFTRGEPGTVRPKYDPTLPARERLHDVYYAQKSFFQLNKRWAKTLAELHIDPSVRPPMLMTQTPEGYEATAIVPLGLEETQSISIGPDSRIKLSPPQKASGGIAP